MAKGLINWGEVKKHQSLKDRWIVIDNKVYDVSSWQNRHPGGRKVIGHYAGQDATGAFIAFHKNRQYAEKFLSAYYVGDLDQDCPEDKDINSKIKEYHEDLEGVRNILVQQIDKDPDTRLEPIFVVGDNVLRRAASPESKWTWHFPYEHQHKYFFLMIDLRVIESHWFTWVSQSNHLAMPVDYDRAEPWFRLQLNGTCNVENSLFNDWFTGHLNFQIEHHLFPTMPRHNYHLVRPYVKALCEKYNLPYRVKPIGIAFKDVFKILKSSAESWKKVKCEKEKCMKKLLDE
ncbi:uncharacterized protein DC041_0009348 [Schistosoma bovis]|uniref:Cytochrome b5 heme-binding domain-containing protein n=1 Tax=Schistosoma bovis TaxID=6184 RepID=A0A430QN10_SCHBO|nr:uncharacterized protein DC041_0009348 [Schistosoma bovis]